MEEKEKKYIKNIASLFIIMIIVVCIGVIILYINEFKVQTFEFDSNRINTKDYQYKVDTISVNDKYIDVAGWIVKDEKPSKIIQISVLLKNGKICYKIPTEMVRRNDITLHYNNGNDYSTSGFHAIVKKRFVDISKEYDIYIYFESDGNKDIVPLDVNTKEVNNFE